MKSVKVKHLSKIDIVRDRLDNDEEVCQHVLGFPVRQQVHYLKNEKNYIIYSERCLCNLVKRKHYTYVKDWAQ